MKKKFINICKKKDCSNHFITWTSTSSIYQEEILSHIKPYALHTKFKIDKNGITHGSRDLKSWWFVGIAAAKIFPEGLLSHLLFLI